MQLDDLPSLPLAVVDVETTGLSAAYGDRICEIGIVCARGAQIVDTFQSLVNPQRRISPGAAQVNGLSDAQVRDAPLFASLAGEILQRINGAVLVGHNTPFDLSFLEAEFARLGLVMQPAARLDTLVMARQRFTSGSNSLAALAARLGVRQEGEHRALADALTTYRVFCAFMGGSAGPAGGLTYSAAVFGPEVELLPPAIQEALLQNKPLTITYVDAKGDATCRTITPLQLIHRSDTLYIRAFCHLRQEERSFRLDRIAVIHD